MEILQPKKKPYRGCSPLRYASQDLSVVLVLEGAVVARDEVVLRGGQDLTFGSSGFVWLSQLG